MSLPNFDFTRAKSIADDTLDLAVNMKHEYVTVEHLLLTLINNNDICDLLKNLKVDTKSIKADLEAHLNSGVIPRFTLNIAQPVLTESFDRVIKRAITNSMVSGFFSVRLEYLLHSIVEDEEPDSFARYFLLLHGLDPYDLRDYIEHDMVHDLEDMNDQEDGEEEDEQERSRSAKKSKYERIIEKYCINLNAEAKNGRIDPLIGRETEVDTMVLTVSRRRKNNIILVGASGVGKTAVVEGLARLIVEDKVPEAIKNAVIYSLDVSSLMASSGLRGELEGRIKSIIEAIEKQGAEKGIVPILFIDEIHMIMNAGSSSSGSLDIANMLKPALARGTLRCIGGTTYEEFRKYFERDRALLRRFQKLDITEPSPEDSKKIIAGLISSYEEHHGVTYSTEAIEAAVDLTVRYITDRVLPDKAIDVIDIAGARQRIADSSEKETHITASHIEREVARIARIPELEVKEDDSSKLEKLESTLKSVIFGQDNAVEEIVSAVHLSRAGLRDPDKPQGCYLFAGPTGVGKTELAKQLSKTLNIAFHRFDMSEYMEKHSVSKFIGSPPSYVGYGDGGAGSGLLCNAVDSDPHCVLLIDEIEKAHPDVYNIFLQIMDNGELTSSAGKKVNFRNVILIMTTNAGASELSKESIGFGNSTSEGNDDKVIESTFAPEFRNRLDAIVKFKHLAKDHMGSVVDKFVSKLVKQASEKNIEIVLSEEAKDFFIRNGFDSKMGARPMARTIQDHLAKPLSREILFGNLKNGGKVNVKVSDNKIILETQTN